MATKSMGYDHPAYQARYSVSFPVTTAGAAATTAKFIAFTALNIYALVATPIAMGSSTYASLWNGTATVSTAVGAQTVSLIHIFNTASAGATPAFGTGTFGPFVLSLYDGTSTNTQTSSAKPGFTNYIPVAGAGVGTAGTGQVQAGSVPAGGGGIAVAQGDQLYCVLGSDATATACIALEYGITPLANVTV